MRRRASLLTRLMVKLQGPAVALGPGMVELIASLLIDLSEQKLYVVNPQHQLLRTMPVSSGRSSSPTPIGASKLLSKFASVTMRGRGYVTPGVPWVLCINPEATVCLHGAPRHDPALRALHPTGGSPGWPCTGSLGGASSSGRGPSSGRGSPRRARWANSQLTAVARRVRRGKSSPMR